MRKVLSRKDVIQELAKFHREAGKYDIKELISDGFTGASEYEVVLEWITYRYASSTNIFLAELYEFVRYETVRVTGDPVRLHPCKCCGYRTIDEPNDYDICSWCGWEDDGTTNPNKRMSINRGSMSEYRAKLRDHSRDQLFHRWVKD